MRLDLSAGALRDPVAVSIGNPHAVFFVEDVGAVALEAVGPLVETDAIFPERANVDVAQILGPDRIRLRVWERGAGVTRACGSGACATLAAAARRGLTGRGAEVVLDGGTLQHRLAEGRPRHHDRSGRNQLHRDSSTRPCSSRAPARCPIRAPIRIS